MNSLVQCLSKNKELIKGIHEHQIDVADTNPDNQLVKAAKSMYTDLENKGESFAPYAFVEKLRTLHPQFNETDDQGRHMQQDSQECFNAIMRSFESANIRLDDKGEEKNLISHLFDIEFEITFKNLQSEEEEDKVNYEKAKMLYCTIDNPAKPIGHLLDGIKVTHEGDVEAHSDFTGTTNIYRKETKMNNLPPYLVVNLVRFFWKKQSVTAGTQAGKSKILKNVAFPMVLDTYDLCSEKLKKSLNEGREYETRLREERDEKILSGKAEDVPMQSEDTKDDKDNKDTKVSEEEKKDIEMEEEKVPTTKREKAKAQPTINDKITYRDHGVGYDTGKYQLIGVVTHQGRTADGGHYIGWIHSSEDEWLQCDDDFVTRVKSQDILNLKGGGDWHMAYLLVYRKIEVVKGDEI